MASQDITPAGTGSAKVSLLNDPRIRGYIYQLVVLVVLVAVGYWFVNNTIANLRSDMNSGPTRAPPLMLKPPSSG